MDIIALNLPRTWTQAELSALFETHGKVTSCQIVMDKVTNTSKGFGFITMPDADEAGAAIAALHGTKHGKNKIRVKDSANKT